MSTLREPVDLEGLEDPVCDTCGCVIEEIEQQCPARDEGVCGA